MHICYNGGTMEKTVTLDMPELRKAIAYWVNYINTGCAGVAAIVQPIVTEV